MVKINITIHSLYNLIILRGTMFKKIWEYGMECDLSILILNKFYGKSSSLMEGCHKIYLELVRKSAWPTYSIYFFNMSLLGKINNYFNKAYFAGKIILNVVPTPSLDSNVMSPLKWALMVEYDMNNPSPVPFFPFVVIISLNSLSWTSFGKPQP